MSGCDASVWLEDRTIGRCRPRRQNFAILTKEENPPASLEVVLRSGIDNDFWLVSFRPGTERRVDCRTRREDGIIVDGGTGYGNPSVKNPYSILFPSFAIHSRWCGGRIL